MVYAIVMAAGAARRMGQQKLLLPLPDGTRMIRRVVQNALGSAASKVAVVVDGKVPSVADALQDLPIDIILNFGASEGMSSSIRLAAAHLHSVGATAGVFLLGDMPGVDPQVIGHVISAYEAHNPVLAQASYRGQVGHPVLFAQPLFAELAGVEGDEGGRGIVAKYRLDRVLVDVDTDIPRDIDTVEDYQTLFQTTPSSGSHTGGK